MAWWADFHWLPVSKDLKSSKIVCNWYTKHFFSFFSLTCGQTLLVYMCRWAAVTNWFPFLRKFMVCTNPAAATALSINRAAADWCAVSLCSNYRNGRDIKASDRAWYWTQQQSPPSFPLQPTTTSCWTRVHISLSLGLSRPISTASLYKSMLYLNNNKASCLHQSNTSNASWRFQSYINKVCKYKMVYALGTGLTFETVTWRSSRSAQYLVQYSLV